MPIDSDMSEVAGIGWYMRRDGTLFTGTNRPDVRWLRRKHADFIGTAEYGPGGSWVEPLESLIVQNEREGEQETAEKLKKILADTRFNIANAGKDHAEARANAKTDEELQMERLAALTVATVEERAAARRNAEQGNSPQRTG